MQAADTDPSPLDEKLILGHPRGLFVLFFTEMWERFSFYGMRGLLILYLTQHFLFSDERSTVIYGAYAALVYVMSIVGGVLADRYLGARKAVTFGAILLVFGHMGMAFEGNGSREIATFEGQEFEFTLDGRGGDAASIVQMGDKRSLYSVDNDNNTIIISNPGLIGLPQIIDRDQLTIRVEKDKFFTNFLYLSLALIIAGVGYLKANISTLVGTLYGENDVRRDSGFTIFYMGINLGAFLASLSCGYLGIVYGWKYGFGLAGIGMIFGLAIFLWGQRFLGESAEPPNPAKLKEKAFLFINKEWACYLVAVAMIIISFALVLNAEVVGSLVGVAGIVMLGVLIWYAVKHCEPVERDRLLAATYFCLAQIPFWVLFEQAASSLNLFTDRLVDRSMFGLSIPAPIFQSLNAGYIFLFAPIIAWLWIWMAKRNIEPSAPFKFAGGVFLVGAGFLMMVFGMNTTGTGALTPVIFVFLIYLVHTLGELMLSPIGLSSVTKLAPARVVGMTMGAWFLYTGLSNYFAGKVAQLAGVDTLGGQITDAVAAKETYSELYTTIGWSGIGVSVLMLLAAPFVKKLMHGIK